MAIRRSVPVTFRASTLCDAVDGTTGPPGAMASLANLVPDPGGRNIFICRPAAVQQVNLSSFLTSPTFISALLVIGDKVYGMVQTTRFAGKDEPFCFDLAANAAVAVSGVKSSNVPTSPAAAGDWVPPIIKQVGSRIIVCHPGFPGGATKFGWFDVSGFSETTTGNTTTSTTITGDPAILGVQPGMTITDSAGDIPANTTVVSTANVVTVTTGDTNSNIHLTNLGATAPVGSLVSGPGIPVGAKVTSVVSGTAVDISPAATATATGVGITFTGTTILMSAAATGSTPGDTLTIAGGTLSAPLWGAGDTDRNNLPSTPLCVAQFNGRAYFGCGKDGIPFSDSGFPCRISNNPNVQVLTTNDGLSVTAIGELQLNSLVGGIVQSLIAFEGASKMQQITGDPTTNNLAMNALPAATGTLAPLSLFSFNSGLGFVSPHGLQYIDFSGNVQPAIGVNGDGVAKPFMTTEGSFFNVGFPSRMAAAANGDVIRVRITTTAAQKFEYWFHPWRNCWTGPHSFASSLIQPWQGSFLMAPESVTGKLFVSDDLPDTSTVYTENGSALTWTWLTSLFPDSGDMSEISLNEAAIACALGFTPATDQTITLVILDDHGNTLDTTTVTGDTATTGLVPVATSNDGGYLGATIGSYHQYAVKWNLPVVVKQFFVKITGNSGGSTRIGPLFLRQEHLGYMLQERS